MQKLQQEDQYQEPKEFEDLPTIEFNFDEVEDDTSRPLPATTPALGSMQPPSRTSDDGSILIHHHHFYDPSMSKLEMALGLWAGNTGISRSEFTSLREILGMIPDHDVQRLPNSLATLKRHVTKELPLLDMWKKSIPLIPEKISTETATRKAQDCDGDVSVPYEDLYFFDPQGLFATFMSSDIVNSMHIGMAEYRDSPSELWHSRCWASSIRTTSGQYAHFEEGNGAPIFPSDFVKYQCLEEDCTRCAFKDWHLGRVISVGRDYCSSALVQGAITLEVREIFLYGEINISLEPPMLPNEAILSWEHLSYLPEHHIKGTSPVNVALDHTSGETKEKKYTKTSFNPSKAELFMWRIVNDITLGASVLAITPLCRTHPIRAELELQEFGRDQFISNWDTKNGKNKCISVPLLTFIDGFGLYRNSYRSLMGFYEIPAALNSQDRARRANVIPLTLGPHGSNFEDVVAALKALIPLDKGTLVDINGTPTTMCIFSLCYIGDMPQQQENSGFKSQRADKGCRFCFIDAKQRGDLNFDINEHGRYHHQAINMRKQMNNLRTATQRNQYGKDWGLAPRKPPLQQISPALDLILSRPADPAHSEYGGITRMMHEMLLEGILTPVA